MKRFALCLYLPALAGCAIAAAEAPPVDRLAWLPLVTYGEASDPRNEHILHFPAGRPVPFNMIVQGGIFAGKAEARAEAVLAKDIYVYKNWVSFDRVQWDSGAETFRVLVDVKLPDYETRGPASVNLRLDAIQ